jgi:peptidoglycan-associated lipoprotein
MFNSRLILAALATVFVVSACRPDPPPPDPAPTGPTPEEIERMRQDSIRAAEEAARLERERLEAEAAAARERAAAAARRTLMEVVYFDYDEATIRSDTEETLRAKLAILRNAPSVQLRMEGHADERGTSEYNFALANDRAESVIRFLTGFGLDMGRFSSVSYGEERPAVQGSTESAWAQNRRVEFVITAGGDDLGR